jgi:methyl-accepting chemotaxis protein
MNKDWLVYRDLTQQAMELSRQNRAQEGLALLAGDADKLFTHVNEEVDEMRANNQEGAEATIQKIDEVYHQGFRVLLMIGAVSFVLALVSGFTTSQIVISQIKKTTQAMISLSQNKLDTDIPFKGYKTEIGQIADTLQEFKKALIAKQEAETAIILENEKKAQRADFMTLKIQSAASASNQTASNVQTVASAAEEVTASIAEITRQIRESSQLAENANHGFEIADQKIYQLKDSSERVTQILSLITDISTQTNLLSLNATIEAARAGEAGKGFAVVASEVKNLAGQTDQAAQEIRSKIEEMQLAMTNAIDSIMMIKQTVDTMNKISGSVAGAAEQQQSAIMEISRNAQQAAQGTSQVNQSLQDLSREAA